MKRAFKVLLLIIVLIYAREGYLYYRDYIYIPGHTKGMLSDIADEVTAIPLKTAGNTKIENAHSIKAIGNNLFFISNNVLYNYTSSGEFVCRVTDPEMIRVAGYVVNQAQKELIVLGNENDIFYYTFDGSLKDRKKLAGIDNLVRMESISMLGEQIWSVEEVANIDPDTNEIVLQRQVGIYDSSFQKIESRALQGVELGRHNPILNGQRIELFASADTGMVYAYTPQAAKDHLFRDSLYLFTHGFLNRPDILSEPKVLLSPFQMNGRFHIANYRRGIDESRNYNYCYDRKQHRYWLLDDGFTDDFYHTGTVKNLEPTDMFCRTYSYTHTETDRDTVLYLVKMKV